SVFSAVTLSTLKVVRLAKWPATVLSLECQVTYGVLPENVMSGSSASTFGFDTGLPPLASSKCVPPTRRDTKMPLWPLRMSSAQAIHGVVAPPGVSVPAAMRGSSAPASGSALSDASPSAVAFSAAPPNLLLPELSSVAERRLPTTTQWNLPPPSLTALAANTMSLLWSPLILLSSTSYQVTHGTVSLGPVNAMSGSMPLRVGSTLSVGSSPGSSASAFRRPLPTCCQQKLLTLVPPPGWLSEQSVCLIARETKIW